MIFLIQYVIGFSSFIPRPTSILLPALRPLHLDPQITFVQQVGGRHSNCIGRQGGCHGDNCVVMVTTVSVRLSW